MVGNDTLDCDSSHLGFFSPNSAKGIASNEADGFLSRNRKNAIQESQLSSVVRIPSMKTNILRTGATSLVVAICIWSTQALAQTTTVTTTKGAFNEYVPGSETMVVRTDAGTSPSRYTV